MTSSQFVVCFASLGWLCACNDIPQAPPEVVPTAPPAKTIVIDSQFYADYAYAIPYPSLVLSEATTFGITYRLFEAGQFRFAGCPIDCEDRRNWVVGDPDPAAADRGEYSAAAAEDERLQTAYQVWSSGAAAVLRYGSCAALCQHSSNWSTTSVDTTGVTGFFVSLAVKSGSTHIAYVTPAAPPNSSRLRHAVCSGNCSSMSAWTTTTVDTSIYGETQIAVDPAGVVHLVYQGFDSDGLHANLKYARCAAGCSVSGNWQISTIGPGKLPSLAVDGLGNLTLAYVEITGPIRIAACAAGCATGAWNGAAIAIPENVAHDVALAVQSSGKSYLAYGTTTAPSPTDYGMVRIGSCASSCSTAGNWQFRTVDSTVWYRPYFLSLALDSAGQAAIAHADSYALRFTLIKQLP